MKKRDLALLLAVICLVMFSGCKGKEENLPESTSPKETTIENKESTSNTEDVGEDKYEYPSEDAGEVVQESSLGYSMKYDPKVFTLSETDKEEVFTYNTEEKLDASIYISIQSYVDMDVETLAKGLALQSGEDGVNVQDAYMGADSIETKSVYIENEVKGIKQTQVFYAIPIEKGSLLVEIDGYVGMPKTAESKIEEMLGTFILKAK